MGGSHAYPEIFPEVVTLVALWNWGVLQKNKNILEYTLRNTQGEESGDGVPYNMQDIIHEANKDERLNA